MLFWNPLFLYPWLLWFLYTVTQINHFTWKQTITNMTYLQPLNDTYFSYTWSQISFWRGFLKSQFLSIWFLGNIKLKLNSIHFSHTVAPLFPLVYYLLSISHLLSHLQPGSLWSLLQVHCQKSHSKLQTVAYFSL